MPPHHRLHHKTVTASVHSPGEEVRVWDCPYTEEEESVGLMAVRVPTLIISKWYNTHNSWPERRWPVPAWALSWDVLPWQTLSWPSDGIGGDPMLSPSQTIPQLDIQSYWRTGIGIKCTQARYWKGKHNTTPIKPSLHTLHPARYLLHLLTGMQGWLIFGSGVVPNLVCITSIALPFLHPTDYVWIAYQVI